MRKAPSRSAILDKLHKGFVLTCVGVTLYAGSVVAAHYYKRYTQIIPEKKRQELLEKENLLAEGASPDTAPTMVA